MSLIAREEKGAGFEPIAEGVHMSLCSGMIDLGNQYSEKFDKNTHKIMIQWDITDETYTDGEGNEKVRTMIKEYSTSLGEKANLRKDLVAWRGKQFTNEELAKFELTNILNVGCQLQITHQLKGEKTYANITSIMALPKGMKVPPSSDLLIFDFDDKDTWENFKRLPEWIQNKIRTATNFEESGLRRFADFDDKGETVAESPAKVETKKAPTKKVEPVDDVDAVFDGE